MKRLSLLLFYLLVTCSCSKEKQNIQKKVDNVFYDKAFIYRDSKNADSAFIYFFKARELFSQQKDSLGVAKCSANMALIATDKGDYFSGQEISLEAIKYFNKNDKKQFVYISSNYNNLGLATHKLQDYTDALKFYDLAIEFSTDPLDTRLYLNNKAKIYQELKAYDKALRIYEEALKEKNKNQSVYARLTTNIALTKWLQNSKYDPSKEFLRALSIRRKEKDLWGQNSSYAHLANYYSYRNADSTLSYAHQMYEVAKELASTEDQLQALQTLIRFSPSRESKQYFESYKSLKDSLDLARSSAKNQFAIIRYDVEKNKADNLVLQKEKIEREIMLFGAALLILIGSVAVIFWNKKRKQKIELQAQNTIQENKLRTSKKIHDVVANGLYRVITEIENQDGMDKEEMLDRLDLMYQKSRDISYEDEEIKLDHQNFKNKITDLLSSFNTKHTAITINGNADNLWEKVNHQVKYEIEYILQELMVNMKKHSKATRVDVMFKQTDNQIHINYKDNGIGIAGQLQYGNGLANKGNRIENIEGEITFDTNLEKGLKILIVFPIA